MAQPRRNVQVSFSAEGITHFGGVLLLHRFVQKLQLRRALTRLLRQRERNSRYSFGELTLAVLYPILLGLGRLETARRLRHNGVFQQITGLHTYPHPSSLRRFLSRLGAKALPGLLQLHDHWRTRWLRTRTARFDLDTTVLTVYGRQQRAAIGFNPKETRPAFVSTAVVLRGRLGPVLGGRVAAGRCASLAGHHPGSPPRVGQAAAPRCGPFRCGPTRSSTIRNCWISWNKTTSVT